MGCGVAVFGICVTRDLGAKSLVLGLWHVNKELLALGFVADDLRKPAINLLLIISNS